MAEVDWRGDDVVDNHARAQDPEENIWMPLMQDGNDDEYDDNDEDEEDEQEEEEDDEEEVAALPNADLNDRMAEMAARRRHAQDVHSRRSKHRFLSYVMLSLGGGLAHIYWALCTRHQFYLAVVYLSSSKFAYVTMGNACICATVLFFRWVVYMCLGGLRNVEQEAIGEGLRWGLMETCLAITIFRQEVDRHMVFLFLTLVLAKSLHWAVEYRGLHLQQTDMMEAHDDHHEEERAHQHNHFPLITAKWLVGLWQGFKKHFGFLFLTYALLLLDLWAVVYCATVCATLGPSVHILFGFEAAILFISATNTLASHGVHWWDNTFYTSRHKTWHGRGTINFALEVALEGCKFVFYMIFFAIVFTYYGMPINIFRDLYMSYVNLKRKVSSFVKYRQLTSNMNARFENATEKELEECGGTCIICRDDITTASGNPGKKLPCGHIFHFYCLREWLQQQQSCPTCRSEIPASWSKDQRIAAEARAAAAAANNNNEENPVEGADTQEAEATQTEEAKSDTHELEEGKDAVEKTNSQDSEEKTATKASLATPAKTEPDHSSCLFTPNTAGQVVQAISDYESKSESVIDQCSSEEEPPFPCLYRVSSATGATVYQQTEGTWQIVRSVGYKKVILCTGLEWKQGGTVQATTGETSSPLMSQMMLCMPDGWVAEADVDRIPIPLSGILEATAGVKINSSSLR